jgi:NAD(P)-dependent dehydrogenase (short-subunit alcohol dehydrogenase family)
MAGSGWTAADIPGLEGRVAVVTGANSGLGLVTARELARAGASVVLACRDLAKGEAARDSITLGSASVARLDLADLGSVREFASSFRGQHGRLDLLINNAGVMAPPRRLTADGFESQLGVNHLGHFALTGLLLPSLLDAEAARVVTVSSAAHRMGRIKFGDLQSERHYNSWVAYGQSKLANLLFCFELQRRCVAARPEVALSSMAAHPGYSATNLQSAGPRPWEAAIMTVTNRLVAQSAEMGALPVLYAATFPGLPGGSFVGPDGLMEGRGHPRVVGAAGRAYDEDVARRLWEVSEELTGVSYEFSAQVSPA